MVKLLHSLTVFIALSVSACAPGLNGVRQSVSVAAATIIAASNALETYDTAYKKQILTETETECSAVEPAVREICVSSTGLQKFNEYKVRRDTAALTITGAWGSVSTVAAAIPLVERGLMKETELSAYLPDLFAAVTEVRKLLGVFNLPGGIK